MCSKRAQVTEISPIYIPLRNHSAYSLLEGAISVERLVQLAVEDGLPALGLTDTSNLFGAMEFSLTAQRARIQPILGCQLRLAHPSCSFGHSLSSLPLTILLFVQNARGNSNLVKLVSRTTVGQDSALHGQLTLDQLEGLTDGLIALSGGRMGPLNQFLAPGTRRQNQAIDLAKTLAQLFEGRFYIELSRYGYGDEEAVESQLISLAFDLHLPLVATQEAFFSNGRYV